MKHKKSKMILECEEQAFLPPHKNVKENTFQIQTQQSSFAGLIFHFLISKSAKEKGQTQKFFE